MDSEPHSLSLPPLPLEVEVAKNLLTERVRQTETPNMEYDLRAEPEAGHVASKNGLWPSSGEEKDPSQELRSTFSNSPLTFKSEIKWF